MIGTPFAADAQSGWLYLPSDAALVAVRLRRRPARAHRAEPDPRGPRHAAGSCVVERARARRRDRRWALARDGHGRARASRSRCRSPARWPGRRSCSSAPPGTCRPSGWLRRLAWLALAALAWGQVAAAHLSPRARDVLGTRARLRGRRALIHDVRHGPAPVAGARSRLGGGVPRVPAAREPRDPRPEVRAHLALEPAGRLRRARGHPRRAPAGVQDRPDPEQRRLERVAARARERTPARTSGRRCCCSCRWRCATPGAGPSPSRSPSTARSWPTWRRSRCSSARRGCGAWSFALPFGDVYLHNPGRLRYLAFLVVPVLGAIGIQGAARPTAPTAREAVWWIGGAATVVLALPLALGAKPERFVVFALGAAAVVLAISRRDAPQAMRARSRSSACWRPS